PDLPGRRGDPGPGAGTRRLPGRPGGLVGMSLGRADGREHADVLRRGPRPAPGAGRPDRRGDRPAAGPAPGAAPRRTAGRVGLFPRRVPGLMLFLSRVKWVGEVPGKAAGGAAAFPGAILVLPAPRQGVFGAGGVGAGGAGFAGAPGAGFAGASGAGASP